jgi:hypothetical protein
MDEIFRSNPKAFVFGDRSLTQRKRPQKFIDAEIARTQDVDSSDLEKAGAIRVEEKA